MSIPESVLYTAVFPRIIHVFMVSGPGMCWKGRRPGIGCSYWQISHKFNAMLSKYLPQCQEPDCKNRGIHYCVSGRPICCMHAARFGFMHQIRRTDKQCLCNFKEEYCLNIASKMWAKSHDSRNVSFSEWKGLLMATFWHKGQPARRFNLSYGTVKEHGDSKGECALETEPMNYISLLYEAQRDMDEYIRMVKTPSRKKIKY